jgi:hypothetical protein
MVESAVAPRKQPTIAALRVKKEDMFGVPDLE